VSTGFADGCQPIIASGAIVEKKIFWICFTLLSLVADAALGLWWGLLATIPILFLSWWIAYRSGWFD